MIILPLRPDASWRHPPIGTIATMLGLLLIHIAWGHADPDSLKPYLLNFQALDPVQWLTSACLHAGWMHLLGNLVFLFVFGAIVEDFLGGWFVPVYLLLSVASGALEQCLGLLGHREGFALGASSAIYGLVALAVLWAPRTRVSTFIWLLIHRPMMVEIRVLWLAGGYMAMQVLSVWIQGGRPSSEFLHACGIVTGLLLGLLCLRERWVDTDGGDLLAPERPRGSGSAPPAAPAGVPWDEQAGRLAAAVESGDHRVAMAAYEILRREHPTRPPDSHLTERLVALCEAGLDFHRAAAVAERAVAAGPVSDTLRLRLARIRGQHLGDPGAGLAQLALIDRGLLDGGSLAEYDRLHDRLERRQMTERRTRSAPSSLVLLLTALSALAAARVGAAEPVKDPWAAPAQGPAADRQPALPLFEPKTVTGRLAVAGGASIDIPKDSVYLTWADARVFLATPPIESQEETPLGLIITEEQFFRLADDRAQARSNEDWQQASFKFLMSEGPVEVHWEDGWIDTSEGLPASDDLMAAFQMHAKLANRRQALGPGLSISIDGWGQIPAFDAKTGILSWAIQAGWQVRANPGGGPGIPALSTQVANICHLGASGTLRLACEGTPNDRISADRLKRISSRVTWAPKTGFTTRQPDEVGERTGGIRRVMLPRIVFGDPANDGLVYRSHGLGFAWILVVIPVAIAGYIFIRRMLAASRPVPATQPAGPTALRCPACGSPVAPGASRCIACGKSLVQR